ncbi:MAG: TldD/PmbA family protein [Promethearchaeota archaeon]
MVSDDESLQIPVDSIFLKKLQNLKDKHQISYFNARFNAGISTNLGIDKGKMKSSHIFNSYGFSIQVFIDGGYGFAVSNVINLNELEKKFNEAAKLAKFASKKAEIKFNIRELDPINIKFVQLQKRNVLDVDPEEKINYLLEQDKNANNYDKRIVNTRSIYSDSVNHKIIYTSDGRFIDTQNSYARVVINAYSKERDTLEDSRASLGITGGFEVTDMGKDLGVTAAQHAIEILTAKPIKGGKYNIIMDPLLTGTFIHEAFGHACEADSVLADESQLTGMIGKKVGKNFINVYDDPTLDSAYGSIMYDSEGIEAKKVQLIENGVLSHFLHNRESSSRMREETTGNGRAASTMAPPQVRMTNTYLEKGNWSLEEMMENLKEGILCINWKYGYVRPSIGQFMFKMERAWRVKAGEKVQLLRDAALSGIMLESLNKITAIGKNIKFDDGTCGKGGQGVPVGSGGPYVRMNDTVIGGI